MGLIRRWHLTQATASNSDTDICCWFSRCCFGIFSQFYIYIYGPGHSILRPLDTFKRAQLKISFLFLNQNILAVKCDFQQSGVLTRVDSCEPEQPPFKRRNSKWCLVSTLTLIEYSRDQQRLWSDCVYAQADLRLCWLHISHCRKSHVTAHMLWVLKELSPWYDYFANPKYLYISTKTYAVDTQK